MNQFPKSFVLLAVVIFSLVAAGCRQVPTGPPHVETPPPMRVVDPDGLNRSRRVAILKMENGTTFRNLDENVKEAIAAAMQETGGREVVDISGALGGSCQMDSVLRGEYPIEVLAHSWRHFHADTVMFARISEFRPYPPMSVGLTIHLVDAGDARLLASVSHRWTLSDPVVQKDYRCWMNHRFTPRDNPSVYYSSPTTFIDFVAHQVAEGLAAGASRQDRLPSYSRSPAPSRR